MIYNSLSNKNYSNNISLNKIIIQLNVSIEYLKNSFLI